MTDIITIGNDVEHRQEAGNVEAFEFTETESNAIEGWLRSYENDNTRAAYRRELRRFVEFIQAAGVTLAVVDTGTVRDFQSWRTAEGGSTASVSRSVSAISSFYLYSAEPGGWLDGKTNPAAMRRVKPSSVHTQPIEMWQVDYLKRAATLGGHAPRDIALIELLFITGVRVSELCSSNVDDLLVRKTDGVLNITGKGGKARTVVIDTQLLEQLDLERPKTAPLILNNQGARLNRYQVTRILTRLRNVANSIGAGIAKLTPHVARATVATELAIAHGAPAAKAQLGHDSLATTQGYIERAEAAADRAAMAASLRRSIDGT